MDKIDKLPNPAVQQFVMDRLPRAELQMEVSSEITFRLPQDMSDRFEQFFSDLDANLEQLRIRSYGVGVTTLEEVFLSVGKDDKLEEEGSQFRKTIEIRKRRSTKLNDEEEKADAIETEAMESDEQFIDDYAISDRAVENVFWLHFYALSVKRWLVSIRALKTIILEIFLPIFLIIAGLAMTKIEFFKEPDLIYVEPD